MDSKDAPQGKDAPDTQSSPGNGVEGAEDLERSEGWLDRLKAAVGFKPGATVREDIEDALAGEDASSSFTPEERAMLRNILKLREVRVEDVMVPRADIEAVEAGTSLGDLLEAFRESGHSRMPVYRDTLDDPLGMVHIKDLMAHLASLARVTPDGQPQDGEAAKEAAKLDFGKVDLTPSLSDANLVRGLLFVPRSMPAASLLASMQASHLQMALVIDEYGGTDGLVSLEDVVEVVVGDIEDEHDLEEGPAVTVERDGIFVADARADLDEVREVVGEDFGRGEDEHEVDTIGGLVFSLIGRIPVRGELVQAPGDYEIEVLDADPRRVKRVRLYKRQAGEPRRRVPRPAGEPGTVPGE